MKSPSGMMVNGVRGFLDNLARLVADRRPRNMVIGRDIDWRPAWRVALVPSYKSHRVAEPIPPELAPQMPVIDDVLEAVGIPALGAAGFEAEDILSSVAARVTGRIEVISGDRDLFALVRDPDLTVLYPEGMGRLAVINEAEIQRRYGIPPRQYAEFAVLRGDPSDGLPGLDGVGPKKAADLLARFGNLDEIIARAPLRPGDADYLARAFKVVRPVTDIPLEIPAVTLPREALDPDRLTSLSRQHGIGSSVDRLLRSLGNQPAD